MNKPIKISGRALAELRTYNSARLGGSYGMGGMLKKATAPKAAPITLRRADYEKAKAQ